MSFSSPTTPESGWPAFLAGAGIDAEDPQLPIRVHALQVLRMLEKLADGPGLDRGVAAIVLDRLPAMLR